MVGSGINFNETKWHNMRAEDGHGKVLKDADIADIIYHVYRCGQVHGNEIPKHYKLLPRNSDGTLAYHIAKGVLNIPETIIWGLMAICVFSSANADISTDKGHFLTLGGNRFSISDWWGLEESFKPIALKYNLTRITLEGLYFS